MYTTDKHKVFPVACSKAAGGTPPSEVVNYRGGRQTLLLTRHTLTFTLTFSSSSLLTELLPLPPADCAFFFAVVGFPELNTSKNAEGVEKFRGGRPANGGRKSTATGSALM